MFLAARFFFLSQENKKKFCDFRPVVSDREKKRERERERERERKRERKRMQAFT